MVIVYQHLCVRDQTLEATSDSSLLSDALIDEFLQQVLHYQIKMSYKMHIVTHTYYIVIPSGVILLNFWIKKLVIFWYGDILTFWKESLISVISGANDIWS